MIITNIESVPGRTIETELGLVQGSTVRGKHIGKDIGAWFKGIVGGEIKGYSELLMEGRDQALERMEADAKSKGADAVVNVRITTASVTGGAAELMAYGTAVKLAPIASAE
ncbi:YbjQ family protein [Kordiimonas sp. SCSIO 12610]|uniref:YbjQ family protein n=1 Tax=Kordiimonas sp. SCSIO 12610 TaxID=2829597 RepID=UPI00210CB766|nr:YbjQ family protein [Kordiimonas sp. SCSIO 12610]UTW56249.1 YbjQ family protein [Kordiimonas sp. SCSIO 12610]